MLALQFDTHVRLHRRRSRQVRLDYYAFTGDLDFLRRVGYRCSGSRASIERICRRTNEVPGHLSLAYNEHDTCRALDDFSVRHSDLVMFGRSFECRSRPRSWRGARNGADGRPAGATAPYPTGRTSWKPSEDYIDRAAFLMLGGPELFDSGVKRREEIDAGMELADGQARAPTGMVGHHPTRPGTAFPFIAAARMGDRDYAAKILTALQGIPEPATSTV